MATLEGRHCGMRFVSGGRGSVSLQQCRRPWHCVLASGVEDARALQSVTRHRRRMTLVEPMEGGSATRLEG